MTTSKNKENPEQSPCIPVSWLTASLLFWPVAIAGAALDLWSKATVFNWLNWDEKYSIINGFLQFIIRENTGAAFSAFQGRTLFLVTVSCVALVVVVGIFFSHKVTSRLVLFATGCITAGIIGNLYDRLFNDGRVRDFIDVYVGDWHWPTFNVADSLLCVGVGLLIISNLISTTGQTRDLPQKEER